MPERGVDSPPLFQGRCQFQTLAEKKHFCSPINNLDRSFKLRSGEEVGVTPAGHGLVVVPLAIQLAHPHLGAIQEFFPKKKPCVKAVTRKQDQLKTIDE